MLRYVLGVLSPARFPSPPVCSPHEVMGAVVIRGHGPPAACVWEDDAFPSPVPAPGTDQILIDVVAASVNPVDAKLCKGPIAGFIYPKPKIPGSDFSGVVRSCPSSSSFAVGQRVFGMLPLLGSSYGSYAEQVCASQAAIVAAPDNVKLVDLAAVPLVACTVIQALRPVIAAWGGREKLLGKSCFIQAGSGGVGSLAVQYCSRILGMHVTATCSRGNFELVKSLGASVCIDYADHSQTLEDQVRDVDVFIDTRGYECESMVLRKGSRIMRRGRGRGSGSGSAPSSFYIRIASSPFAPDGAGSDDPLGLSIREARLDRVAAGFAKQFFSALFSSDVQYRIVFVTPDAEALAEIAAAMSAGKIRAVIHKILPVREAAAAHAEIEKGHSKGGKIVLTVRPDIE